MQLCTRVHRRCPSVNMHESHTQMPRQTLRHGHTRTRGHPPTRGQGNTHRLVPSWVPGGCVSGPSVSPLGENPPGKPTLPPGAAPGAGAVLSGPPGVLCGGRFPALSSQCCPACRGPSPALRAQENPVRAGPGGLSDPAVWALPSLAVPTPPHPSTRLGPPRCPAHPGPLPLALLPTGLSGAHLCPGGMGESGVCVIPTAALRGRVSSRLIPTSLEQ